MGRSFQQFRSLQLGCLRLFKDQMHWVAARFAGRPARNGCPLIGRWKPLRNQAGKSRSDI